MEIILYKNSSPNNFITKKLTNSFNIEGTLRGESSIIEPELSIQIENPSIYNYIYIPDFKRFYYINNMESYRNNIWKLECRVDVLNTYRSEILNHQAIIDKQTSLDKSELFLDDGDFIVKNQKYVTVKSFPSGLISDGEFILITAGA